MEYVYQQITDYTDTNLTETATEWSSATSYVASDEVLLGVYVWEAVSANTDKNPVDYQGIYWIKSRISNKYAMLDLSSLSASLLTGGFFVEFDQGLAQTLVIGRYTTETLTIEVLDALDNVLWTFETESTINDNVIDYWSYIYEDYNNYVDRSVKIDIPIVGDRIKVTFNGIAIDTSCGFLIAGEAEDMGRTIQDVKFKFNSYAKKTFDDFGTLKIVKRSVQDIVDFETTIDRALLMDYKRKLKAIYNDIIAFIVDDDTEDFENLITLGVIQDADVILSDSEKSIISYSIIEAI